MDWSINKILIYKSGLFDFDALYNRVSGDRWRNWADRLRNEIPAVLEISKNGHLPMWTEVFEDLPKIPADQVHLDQAVIKVKSNAGVDKETSHRLEQSLLKLLPWRKGPFRIHDVYIDTEWQCNLKWDRIEAAISPLDGRRVLDVGCGNGYYAMRMLGAGAKFVIGLDPYLRYIVQFKVLSHFLGDSVKEAQLAPVGFESLPPNLQMFDTVFSMGVIYHHRSPFDHLQSLFGALRSGGELVLETIVVEGNEQTILVPEGRYSKMRNVWFLPSPLALENWLKRVGFINVRIVNVSTTTLQEQRSTRWMPFESLADFLDPMDSEKSFEGYPAPQRAVLVAQKP